MKKWILAAFVAVSFGFIFGAHAQDDNEIAYQVLDGDVVVRPLERSCEHPYLKPIENCWTTKECPPSYTARARYCKVKGHFKFYRCGWVCESPYMPGGH